MAPSKKWKDTVDLGLTDAAWDKHDGDIKSAVDALNKRLATTPDFVVIDWLWVKAMLWTESGGPTNAAWSTRPLQIGNPGDPAFDVLKRGAEGTSEVMDDALKAAIKTPNGINTPATNIQAATAYLFARLATFAERSVVDPADTKEHTYTTVSGDTLWKISRKEGTTVEELTRRNAGVEHSLGIGKVLSFRKAKMKLVITGWRKVTAKEIADRYNGGGDADYADKLTYVKALFPKLVRKK